MLSFHRLFEHLKDGGIYVIENVQTSFWPVELVGTVWDGHPLGDPEFGRTCVGQFLALTPYLNHQELMTLDGMDETRLLLGRRIRRISFEHNLIIVEKGPNSQPPNSVRRPN
jgi:hypothetical protein